MTTYFYTASATTGDIGTYRLDHEAGRVTHVATTRAGGNLSAIAIHPDRHRLYVADRTAPGIVTYSIDPRDGALTELASTPTASQLVYLSLAADQRTIYGASYRDGTVCAHPVDADGVAGTAPHPPLPLGEQARCHAVVEGPDGELWVSALGHDLLHRVARDPATGVLAERHPPVHAGTGSGPRHLCLTHERAELYVIGERDARITALSLTPGGARRAWDTLPADIQLAPGIVRSPDPGNPTHDPDTGLPFTWAADLALSPDGRLLFSSERSSSTVSVTSARTGELLDWVRTERQPRGIAVDPSGAYLLVTGELSATVSLYRIDSSAGTLRLTDRAPSLPGLVWAEAADLADTSARCTWAAAPAAAQPPETAS